MFLLPPPPLLPPLLLRHACDGRHELQYPDGARPECIGASMVEDSIAQALFCQMRISGRSMGDGVSPLKSGPSACSSRSTHREVYSFTGALSNLPIASAASVLQQTTQSGVPGLQIIVQQPQTIDRSAGVQLHLQILPARSLTCSAAAH